MENTKYRVKLEYTIEIEAETEAQAIHTAMYQYPDGNETTRNLNVRVIGQVIPTNASQLAQEQIPKPDEAQAGL